MDWHYQLEVTSLRRRVLLDANNAHCALCSANEESEIHLNFLHVHLLYVDLVCNV